LVIVELLYCLCKALDIKFRQQVAVVESV
jgi:hypothetical protein